VERLEKIAGTTPFVVAYVVQAALEGHSIPIDAGTLRVLLLTGAINEQDAAAQTVPGLERAIPKNAGVEFGSLLHQLGADFVAGPYTPSLHHVLLEINPEIKDRLPRRRDAKSSVLAPSAASPASGRGEKLKKPHRAPEGHEPGKGQAEAEGKGQTAERRGKADAKAKLRPAPTEPTQAPAAASVEETAGPPKKKSSPAKKKPAEAPLPAQAAPPGAAAQEETGESRDDSAEKQEPATAKKKTSSKKPAEAVKSTGETDDLPSESEVQGLSKRKPR
jgi:hypothetical protein